jgi:hypothetical protein
MGCLARRSEGGPPRQAGWPNRRKRGHSPGSPVFDADRQAYGVPRAKSRPCTDSAQMTSTSRAMMIRLQAG